MVRSSRRPRFSSSSGLKDVILPSPRAPRTLSTTATWLQLGRKDIAFQSVETGDVVMQDKSLEGSEGGDEVERIVEAMFEPQDGDGDGQWVSQQTPKQEERLPSPGAFGFGNDPESLQMFFEALKAAKKYENEKEGKQELRIKRLHLKLIGGGTIVGASDQFGPGSPEQMDIQMEDETAETYLECGYLEDMRRLKVVYFDAWAQTEKLLDEIKSGTATRSIIKTVPKYLRLIAREIQERKDMIAKLETDVDHLLRANKSIQLIIEKRHHEKAIIESLEDSVTRLNHSVVDVDEIGYHAQHKGIKKNDFVHPSDTKDEPLAPKIAALLLEYANDIQRSQRGFFARDLALRRNGEIRQDKHYLCQCISEITRHKRSSPPILPHGNPLISDLFVENKVHFTELEFDPQLMSRVISVIKVNKMERDSSGAKFTRGEDRNSNLSGRFDRELRSAIYYQHPDMNEWCYSNHPSLSPLIIPFNPYGRGSYQVYKCNNTECGNTYKIGHFKKSKVPKNLFHHGKDWYTTRESFGCSLLDEYFGLISRKQREDEEYQRGCSNSWNDWRDDSGDGDHPFNGAHNWRAPHFPYYQGELPGGIDELWKANDCHSPETRAAHLKSTFRVERCCSRSANESLGESP